MMRWIFTAIALLLAMRVGAEYALPSERVIVWQDRVGIPGGIPARATIAQTLSSGATMAQIQTALNNAASETTVLLEAGSYTITGLLTIPSDKTLRGSGSGNTTLTTTGSGDCAIRFGSKVEGEYSGGTEIAISSGYTKGSSNLVFSSVAGMSVGKLMIIDQANAGIVSNTGFGGTADWVSRDSGTRAMGQISKITEINGTTVTIWPPMNHTLTAGNSPEARHWTAGATMGGLEDLKVVGTNSGYDALVDGQGAEYCWLKGVELAYPDGDYVRLWYGYRHEVRDSYFHDAFSHTSGSTDACIMLALKTSYCLIENNIILRSHIGVMLNWGASGNVIGYNYLDFEFDSGSQNVLMYALNGNHGAHPSYNLFEGNWANMAQDDSYWGSSSHATYFRNRLTADNTIFPPYTGTGAWQTNSTHHPNQGLRGLSFEYLQRTNNIIGNVVGNSYVEDHDVRLVVPPTSRLYDNDPLGVAYLFSFGYVAVEDEGSGAFSSGQGVTIVGDSAAYDTALMHGNFDTVTSNPGVVYNGGDDTDLPDSLYLSSKPSWFGDRRFPTFEPTTARSELTGGTLTPELQPAGYRYLNNAEPPEGGGGSSGAATVNVNALRIGTIQVAP